EFRAAERAHSDSTELSMARSTTAQRVTQRASLRARSASELAVCLTILVLRPGATAIRMWFPPPRPTSASDTLANSYLPSLSVTAVDRLSRMPLTPAIGEFEQPAATMRPAIAIEPGPAVSPAARLSGRKPSDPFDEPWVWIDPSRKRSSRARPKERTR